MTALKMIASANFITFSKPLARIYGLNEALILGELLSEYYYWEKRDLLDEGMFFSTIENIRYQTTLGEDQQRRAIRHLQNLGVLDVKVRGIPAKRYFSIDFEKVEADIKEFIDVDEPVSTEPKFY